MTSTVTTCATTRDLCDAPRVSNNATSCDNLAIDTLSFNSERAKLQRYYAKVVGCGREVLARDHTYDRRGSRIITTVRYLCLHDKICDWITQSTDAELFRDASTHPYLAQMAIIMRTIDIALAVSHRPFNWPGAALDPHLCWPGVAMREAYRQVDELIYTRPTRGCQTVALSWPLRHLGPDRGVHGAVVRNRG
ncbi:hypothetical protein G6514_009248 [Epicoccum nigrum]|nr:hypothetical protein G6514_009248 [Epicoccum nigrum]